MHLSHSLNDYLNRYKKATHSTHAAHYRADSNLRLYNILHWYVTRNIVMSYNQNFMSKQLARVVEAVLTEARANDALDDYNQENRTLGTETLRTECNNNKNLIIQRA